MDDIINEFTHFSVNDTTQSEMDNLISKISNIEVDCPNAEWNSFQENYSKLKELKNIKITAQLKKPFELFMDKMTEINQHYINYINLDPEYYCESSILNDFKTLGVNSIKSIITRIYDSLENALNSHDNNQKLDYTLDAYYNIITIVEDFTDLKYQKFIDPYFEKEFNIKRRKLI